MIETDMQRSYNQGRERERLAHGAGVLEFARTQELLQRYLPPPQAEILDVVAAQGSMRPGPARPAIAFT